MKIDKKILIPGVIVIAILVLIGGGIYIYYSYFMNNSTNSGSTRTFGNFRNGANAANFGFVTGSVDSISNNTAIINDSGTSGGQTIVILSDTTRITKTETDSESDVLSNGANITVQGTRSGTTISASKIVLPIRIARPSGAPSNRGQGGFFFRRGNANNSSTSNQAQFANTFSGTVSSLQGNTFQLSSRNGTTYTVTISNTTTYGKQVTGSLSDITSGETITAAGTKDQTGSITANTVMIGSN